MYACMYVCMYVCIRTHIQRPNNPPIPSSLCDYMANLHNFVLHRERANPRVPPCNDLTNVFLFFHLFTWDFFMKYFFIFFSCEYIVKKKIKTPSKTA